jgi:hypothetical protein
MVLLVDQRVLLVVLLWVVDLLRICIFWAWAFFRPVVLSTRMGSELFCQYLLRLVDLVDPGLWLGIVQRHHRLRDP